MRTTFGAYLFFDVWALAFFNSLSLLTITINLLLLIKGRKTLI